MFDRCCKSHSLIEYIIIHNPQPIVLSDAMDEVLKTCCGMHQISIHIKLNAVYKWYCDRR